MSSLCLCLGRYYTPQVKRRRVQDEEQSSSTHSFGDQMDILRDMLKEINKKIDVVNQREGVFGKKLDNVDKRLGGLIRQVNKVREIVPNVLSLQCSLNQYTL